MGSIIRLSILDIFAVRMKLNRFHCILLPVFLLLAFPHFSRAQSNEEIKDTTAVSVVPAAENAPMEEKKPANKTNLLPSIGFGPGLMTFFGDLKKNKTSQPIRYRVGWSVFINEQILPFLELSAFFNNGALNGNQRDTIENYNFRSLTSSAGLEFVYNFSKPFYSKAKKPPVITPFLGAGFEYIMYNTKTDLLDKNGKKYFYWTTGAIKDIDQNALDAAYAEDIYRDYDYETSLTKGTTFGIPLSAGFQFNFSQKFNVDLGATYHLTMTDKIDNLSIGKNDSYLFTTVSLRWNIGAKTPYSKLINGGENYNDADFLALEKDDSDGDGIKDMDDNCSGTPAGVQVDEKGCPLDDDKDGVPNYADLEANTPLGALVDAQGYQITDDYIDRKNAEEEAFLSGSHAADVVKNITYSPDEGGGSSSGGRLYFDRNNKDGISFKVQLGAFKDGIPPDQVETIMKVQDVTNFVGDDGFTIYTAGAYGSKLAAESRRDELSKYGIKGAKIIAVDKSGKLVDINSVSDGSGSALSFSGSSSYEIIYKVQLGAYSKKVPASMFSGITPLTSEPGPNGLTRYLGGSFSTYNSAMTYRNGVRAKGFDGAFVVAFKDGNRIDLGQAERAQRNVPEPSSAGNKTNVQPSVVFKIQLAVFKNELPDDLKSQYSSFAGFEKTVLPNGLKKYTAGAFGSYQEAVKYKDELISKGVKGAFVIGFINGKQVSLNDALKEAK